MKKFFTKALSLLLVASALCIPFAFHVGALTTICQECGGSNVGYIGIGDVGCDTPSYHHEVYCYSCGHSVYEESCEWDGYSYSSSGHYCECGQLFEDHSFGTPVFDGREYIETCTECGYSRTAS